MCPIILGVSRCSLCDGTIDSFGEILSLSPSAPLPALLRDFFFTSLHRACLRRSLFEPIFRAVFVADALEATAPEDLLRLTKTRYFLRRYGEDVVFGVFPEYFLFACSVAEFVALGEALVGDPNQALTFETTTLCFHVTPYREGVLLKTLGGRANQFTFHWIVFSREQWETFRTDWRTAASSLCR